MGNPTFFQDDSAKTAREAEVAAASFANGCNFAGSCAPGVGINMGEGAVVGTPEQFTLLDQDEAARTPQVSQPIGGDAFVDRSSVPWDSSGGVSGKGVDSIRDATNPANVNGQPDNDAAPTPVGNAHLATLGAGWTSV